jgi:glycosyltransferase involved in cell wall biosynthesis
VASEYAHDAHCNTNHEAGSEPCPPAIEDEKDPANAVVLGYVHDGDEVTYSFYQSTIQLLNYDLMKNARIWSGGWVAIRCGTDGLQEARNLAVKGFLSDDKADWMLWVDTDMGFPPDVVDRLFDAADPVERPVMGALCFANRDIEDDLMGGRRTVAGPVIMHWTHDGDKAGFDIRWDYPQDTVVRCDGIGSACVLIHRSVFEKVRERYGENWYTRARNPSTGNMVSEDLSFCVRLMALGIPVHVHTGVKTTHMKPIWLAEEDYWAQRALNAPPPKRSAAEGQLPIPDRTWTVPRYAIIPTRNRPARLLSLVVSLGTQVDTIVVLDNASTPPVDVEKLRASVPDRVTVEVIRDEEQPPNLARFWNVMFDRCAELAKDRGEDEWDVAVLNDDSAVPASWYKACAGGLRRHGTAVIAHTTPTSPALLTELHNDPNNRMTPHAFVIRGDLGLRADESMRWWYQDSDLDWRARLAGGVLSVDGPRVVNMLANTTTTGPLAEQAAKDAAAFEAKWSK